MFDFLKIQKDPKLTKKATKKKVATKKVSAVKEEKAQIREVLRDIKAVQRKMKRAKKLAQNGEEQSAIYRQILDVAKDISIHWIKG